MYGHQFLKAYFLDTAKATKEVLITPPLTSTKSLDDSDGLYVANTTSSNIAQGDNVMVTFLPEHTLVFLRGLCPNPLNLR